MMTAERTEERTKTGLVRNRWYTFKGKHEEIKAKFRREYNWDTSLFAEFVYKTNHGTIIAVSVPVGEIKMNNREIDADNCSKGSTFFYPEGTSFQTVEEYDKLDKFLKGAESGR